MGYSNLATEWNGSIGWFCGMCLAGLDSCPVSTNFTLYQDNYSKLQFRRTSFFYMTVILIYYCIQGANNCWKSAPASIIRIKWLLFPPKVDLNKCKEMIQIYIYKNCSYVTFQFLFSKHNNNNKTNLFRYTWTCGVSYSST